MVSRTLCVMGSTNEMLLPLVFAVSTAGTACEPATGVPAAVAAAGGATVGAAADVGGTALGPAGAQADETRARPSTPATPSRLTPGQIRMLIRREILLML